MRSSSAGQRARCNVPVKRDPSNRKTLAPANRDARKPSKEPLLTQLASFAELFVWLLVLKSFFLPLFIIPTGSMAESLAGAHATHTCPNCGYEYQVGFHEARGPAVVQCPNCRLQLPTASSRPDGVRLIDKAGDRIVVHGWPFDIGGYFAPRRWDVVVFKNPNEPEVNFIKRLLGLPGETIELIDGDLFVQGKHERELLPARKTKHAQRALWFPYYDHDYLPRAATTDWAAQMLRLSQPRWPEYRPRWTASAGSIGWQELETRAPLFRGLHADREEITFAAFEKVAAQNWILDVYGYNSIGMYYNNVTDVRLSADVRIKAGDGFVEFVISKYEYLFHARLYADGRLSLERSKLDSQDREPWGETEVPPSDRPIRMALGHADYHVCVEIDGHPVLESTSEQYSVNAERARELSRRPMASILRIAAEKIEVDFSHLLIERDVYYTSGNLREGMTQPGTGTQNHPLTLNDDAYFVCGDNSPGSHDSRAWSESTLGPHLRRAYAEGTYALGTVPADQMIGRAFFVYWPGFMPLSVRGPNLLPDFGRIRWIH